MNHFKEKFIFNDSADSQVLHKKCLQFLKENNFNFEFVKSIDVTGSVPIFIDNENRKFSIDFKEDKKNYHKTKSTIKNEIISKALGSGRYGLKVLDLSAGLGVDAVFLSQLGYQVTAVERNPLIYLALSTAVSQLDENKRKSLEFVFDSAENFLKKSQNKYDVIYFDPMFPHKKKSALPKQEMIFFRNLVGDDSDSVQVLKQALQYKGIQRVVVKRPLKADSLIKPQSQTLGKLVRFDIYGVHI